MGLLDKVRGEFVDIIEWVDDSRHTLVWRFPRYHNQIKYGAQLVVRPGKQGNFINQGKVADIFAPGQYSLETKNLPVLSTLQGWKYGFDSPFKAEVYFVATRQVTDLKWGTPNPVLMRDRDFGPIRIRAFGNYTLKAVDPRTLLVELVATDARFEADEISELLRAIVAGAFADVIASSEIAVLDLAQNYDELSETVRRAVVERIDDEYGLDIPQLQIVNISVPPEVEKALDTRTSMNMIGDLGDYQRYQLGRSMPVAAANPAGGLAGAGVGLGMGMSMAQQMMPGQAAAVPPPPPAAWHVCDAGRTTGPYDEAAIAGSIAARRIRADTLLWSAGMSGWTPAARVGRFGGLFRDTPPPPPPPAPPASGHGE